MGYCVKEGVNLSVLIFDGLGDEAVVIFFVISGFVMMLSVFRRNIDSVRAMCLFLLQRVVRIYPVYIAAFMVSSINLILLTRLAPNADSYQLNLNIIVSHLFFYVPFV